MGKIENTFKIGDKVTANDNPKQIGIVTEVYGPRVRIRFKEIAPVSNIHGFYERDDGYDMDSHFQNVHLVIE